MVSVDSSMSSAARTCSITSWSTVPVDLILTNSSRSVARVASRSRRYSSVGVSPPSSRPSFSHIAFGRLRIRLRTVLTMCSMSAGLLDPLELGDRGDARRLQHRGRLQRVGSGVRPAQPQGPDQRRQGQTLQQQRPGGDQHGGEDQRLAMRHVHRDQQGGGKRDHAAQPGPTDHQRHTTRAYADRRRRDRAGTGRSCRGRPRAAGARSPRRGPRHRSRRSGLPTASSRPSRSRSGGPAVRSAGTRRSRAGTGWCPS